MKLAAGLCLQVALTGGAAAQSANPAGFAFRYAANGLDCATFTEQSHATLDAQTGGRQRHETLSREGRLRLRARPAGTRIALEAWYDSLALGRQSPEATLAPDTDGLLGGRYRGTLSTAGHYDPVIRPFVPDGVAEVADLGAAMDEMLPPLPPVPLAVGQRWIEGGLTLHRLADSVDGPRVLRRLALRQRTESNRATVRGDTTRLAAREVTVEAGRIDWEDRVGLVRRARRIVVETTVPAGGPLRLPLRSRLAQETTLTRTDGHACSPSP